LAINKNHFFFIIIFLFHITLSLLYLYDVNVINVIVCHKNVIFINQTKKGLYSSFFFFFFQKGKTGLRFFFLLF